MNILYLNTTYICGGAENVARQIMYGMQQRGHQVYEIVSYHKRPDVLPKEVSVLYHGAPLLLLNRAITGNHSNASITIPYSLKKILSFIRKNNIQLVHLHNPHGNFLGIGDIKKIADICPVVWTLHDFWAVTGHCASPTNCPDKWKDGCKSCEQLQNYPPLRKDISQRLLLKKKQAFHHENIYLTVPSHWMQIQVQQSHMKEQECVCIPNSLNPDDWTVFSKETLRQKYAVPANKRILAFVAADPEKPLKGMSLLIKSLQLLSHPEKYHLLIAGQKNDIETILQSGFSVQHFGYLTNQTQMNEFYALADILVNPSVYETFGLVNIEAMASGTPVIAFSVCAMPEIITPQTGWCVPSTDETILAETIEHAFSDSNKLKEKGPKAREHVAQHFSEEKMLGSYEALYKKATAE